MFPGPYVYHFLCDWAGVCCNVSFALVGSVLWYSLLAGQESAADVFSVTGSAALRFDWLYFRSGLCQLQSRVSLMKSEETYCVYVTVWFCCVSVFVLHAWCPEGQKRPLDFLDWSYRRLWAIILGMRLELESSDRAASVLNLWANPARRLSFGFSIIKVPELCSFYLCFSLLEMFINRGHFLEKIVLFSPLHSSKMKWDSPIWKTMAQRRRSA